MQQNLGIVARRRLDWTRALEHFDLARTIEPGYCEPSYYHALTLFNQGIEVERGIRGLEESVKCKYVASDAVQALNTIYKYLHERSPEGGKHLVSWASVLLKDEVGRPFEACGTLEQAAHLALDGGPLPRPDAIKAVVDRCLKASMPPLDPSLAKFIEGASPGDIEAIHARAGTALVHVQGCLRGRYKARPPVGSVSLSPNTMPPEQHSLFRPPTSLRTALLVPSCLPADLGAVVVLNLMPLEKLQIRC